MKKTYSLLSAILIIFCSFFSLNAKAQEISLGDLREAVNEINAECPKSSGNLDLLSCTLDSKYLYFTFSVAEELDGSGFTIDEMNEMLANEVSADDFRAAILISCLSDDLSAGLILGAAMNDIDVKYKFISQKTKRTASFVITASEIESVIEYFFEEE